MTETAAVRDPQAHPGAARRHEGARASPSPSTISAPATPRSSICAASRSTSSRSTAPSCRISRARRDDRFFVRTLDRPRPPSRHRDGGRMGRGRGDARACSPAGASTTCRATIAARRSLVGRRRRAGRLARRLTLLPRQRLELLSASRPSGASVRRGRSPLRLGRRPRSSRPFLAARSGRGERA